MVDFQGVDIETAEILDHLKHQMILGEVCQKIIQKKIIVRAALERNISVTAEEIQVEAESTRRELQLEKASDTLEWLKEHLIVPEEWEASIRDRLLADKVAASLFEPEVEKYFAEHRLDFEEFVIYQIVVPYEQLAQEILYQIEEEEISFFQAAHFYDVDERRRYRCGYEGKVSRWSLEPAIAAVLGAICPGQIGGPIQTEQGYHLFLLQELIQAELTPEIRKKIIDRLFQDWLSSELVYLVHHQ